MSNYRDSIEINECVLCGTKRQSRLDVDHIDSNHNNNNPENLQTLCKFCHRFKTQLDKGKHGLFFNSLVIYCADITATRKKIRRASTEWWEQYGKKHKGNTKFTTRIEDVLDAEDLAEVDKIYQKQLLIWVDTKQYMDGDWAEPMKIHPKNPSTTFTFLNDLVLRETYNTAWLNNIIKDEIIDDKLVFTFSNKNSKDYFMNYYWNHNYWQKKFRPFLRKLIKTVYGKDYKIFVKVEDYIAPEKKHIQKPESISERISKKPWSKMSNKERYPLMHDFSNPLKSRIAKEFPWSKNPLGEHDWEDVKRDLKDDGWPDTKPAKPKRRESLKYDYKYRFRPR